MPANIIQDTEFTLISDTEIQMVRSFKAPKALVFDAYTKPEHVRNWYGHRDWTMTVCEADLRVGGKWRYVVTDPEKTMVVAFNGVYEVFDRPDRLVNTEVFEDFPDNPSLVTTVFEETDGVTRLTSVMKYDSIEVRDMVISTGMEGGAAESMQRMAELLETLG